MPRLCTTPPQSTATTAGSTTPLRAYEKSRTVRRELAAANPADADTRRGLSLCANDIGLILVDTGRPAEALAAFEESRRINQALVEAFPDDGKYRRDLTVALTNIGTAHRMAGRPVQARAAAKEARAILQKLADAHPAVSAFLKLLAELGAAGSHEQSLPPRPGE